MMSGFKVHPAVDRAFKDIAVAGQIQCVPWTGTINDAGYGIVIVQKKGVRAHRYMYECFWLDIEPGKVLDHLCRNRACVNPFHLEAVTQRENLLRGETLTARNAAAVECPSGHPYDELNTRWYRGTRRCKACDRNRQRILRERRRSAQG